MFSQVLGVTLLAAVPFSMAFSMRSNSGAHVLAGALKEGLDQSEPGVSYDQLWQHDHVYLWLSVVSFLSLMLLASNETVGKAVKSLKQRLVQADTALQPTSQNEQSLSPESSAESSERLKFKWSNAQTDDLPPDSRLEQVTAGAPPGNIAILTSDGEAITYSELEQRSTVVAAVVLSRIAPDSPRNCGLLTSRSPEMIYGMIGILKASASYVPLPPNFPEERLTYIMNDGGIQLVAAASDLLAGLNTYAPKGIFTFGISDVIADASSAGTMVRLPTNLSPDEVAVVLYTSGSTGKPKGVELTHRAEMTAVVNMAKCFYRSTDKVLVQKPFNFDVSICEIWSGLAAHATLVLAPPNQTDMLALHQTFQSHKPDIVLMVPSVFSVYMATYGIPESRFFSLAGEAFPADLWNQMQTHDAQRQVYNHYGPTEVSVYATEFGPEPAHELVAQHKAVPIGKPMRWRECYVMSTTGSPTLLDEGHIGELWLAGPGLANGYLNLPEKTASVFVPHPVRCGEKAYRTGDLARWLPCGNLLCLGRIDTQVKLHGLRVELAEIESVFRECDSVAEAVVVKHRAPNGDEKLVAFVSPQTANLAEALAKCRQQLPSYMVPAVASALEDWPRNGAGKIDRNSLATRPLHSESGVAESQDAGSTAVWHIDSLAQMRLISTQSLAEVAHLQSMLGIAVVCMTMAHSQLMVSPEPLVFSSPNASLVYHGGIDFLVPSFVTIFVACAAYIEASTTSTGDATRSDAYCFTWREPLLLVIWFAWAWPVPQILTSFLYILTGSNHHSEILKGMYLQETGREFFFTRWLLFFFVFAKACLVLMRALRLPSAAQVGSVALLITYAIFMKVPWVFAYRGVTSQPFLVYFCLLFLHVVIVNYGPFVMRECVMKRLVHHGIAQRIALAIVAGAVYVGVRSHFGRLPYDPSATTTQHITHLFLMPIEVLLFVLFIPATSLFSFMGRHVLGVFLVHRAMTWNLFHGPGISIHGLINLPSCDVTAQQAILLMHKHVGGDVAEGLSAFFVLFVYAFVMVLVAAPVVQSFIVGVPSLAVNLASRAFSKK